jgi:hypothetical protein
LYRTWMRQTDPQRLLYLAVDVEAAQSVFAQAFGRVVAEDVAIRLIVVDVQTQRIVQWKHFPTTDV